MMTNIEAKKAKIFKPIKILMYSIYIFTLFIIFIFSNTPYTTILSGVIVSVFFYLTYNFVYHLVILEPIRITTEKNDVKKAVGLLVESIKKSKKTFFAVTGTGRKELWNDDKVVEALLSAKKRGVIVKIVTGPLEGTTVSEGRGGKSITHIDNKLKKLNVDGTIQLTILDKSPEQHYRITDNLFVVAEDMECHSKDDEEGFTRQYKIYQNNFFVINRYEKSFNELSVKELTTLFE